MRKIIFTLAITLLFSACKKDNTANTQQCRISKAIITEQNTNIIYSISYNSSGMPSVITGSAGSDFNIKSFVYEPNKITTISTDISGNFGGKQVITLNNNNRIVNIKKINNTSGTNWSNTQIVYDNNDVLLKEITTNSSNNTSSTINFTVANGDIVMESNGTSTTTYDFYLDKPSAIGDYFRFYSLIRYGIEDYKKSSHLAKSALASGSASPALFTYELNNEGMISKLSVSNNTGYNIISYEYECY